MKYTLILPLSSLALTYGEQITDAKIGKPQPAASSTAQATTYTFTKDTTISFTGSKVVGSHDGGFKKFSGEFQLENGKPTGGSFTINMKSLWSDSKKLTGHLKNEDFFHVSEHPESSFVVTKFEQKSETQYTVSGNLTMVGITQNISFPATVSQSGDRVTVSSKFNLNRQKWGINYPGMPDNLIKDAVLMQFSLIAKK